MQALSVDELRSRARALVARHGAGALTLAEWKADEFEEVGRRDEAKQWRMIAGTIMAIIDG